MALEFFSGRTAVAGASMVGLNCSGHVYVTASLGRQWPEKLPYVRIGYDREARVLALAPAPQRVPGAAKMRLENGTARRANAKSAIAEFGLLPTGKAVYPARWHEGMIVVDLTAGTEVRVRGQAPPAPASENLLGEAGDTKALQVKYRSSGSVGITSGLLSMRATHATPGVDAKPTVESAPDQATTPPAGDDMVDLKQVSQLYGISLPMLWQLSAKGRLPPKAGKRGAANVYRRADIATWAVARQPGKSHDAIAPRPVDTSATRQPGDPCCLNCIRYRQPTGLNHSICRAGASPFMGQATKPRDWCSVHKPWGPAGPKLEDGSQ